MAQKNTKEDVIKQIMALVAVRGWEDLSFSDFAEETALSEDELYTYFEDKTDILVGFGRMIDRQVLENYGGVDSSIAPRDQLFDIFMDRYEALGEYREALIFILSSFKLDPKQAVISMPHLCRSVTEMLEVAGIDTSGIQGALSVAGATGVYLKVLKVWKKDDSADLSKTMAALDKDLVRAEKIANFLGM